MDEDPDLYERGSQRRCGQAPLSPDLEDPVGRDLVEKNVFERLMADRGIGNDTTLVPYGDKNNWFAAYAYWNVKIYGHEDVRILDGARQETVRNYDGSGTEWGNLVDVTIERGA